MPTDTKEQTAAYIAALLREKQGVEARLAVDDPEIVERAEGRLAAIDAELRRVGHEAKPPHRRAEHRPAPGREER